MEMTADRLDGNLFGEGIRWNKILIGVLPLLLLLTYLAVDGEKLLGEPEIAPLSEYYPPVAVVFVASGANARRIDLSARVRSQRTAALRAHSESRVVAMSARVGDTVAAGQQVCRLAPVDGGEDSVHFSPIHGRVQSISGVPGSIIEGGQPCAMIHDPDAIVAVSKFPPRYADFITPGNRVTLTIGEQSFETVIRVVYPSRDAKGLDDRPFEVVIPEGVNLAPGAEVMLRINTDQVIPTLVPFEALMLIEEKGLCVRIVHGTGPTGVIETVPVTLIATAGNGFYIEGVPEEARLVLRDNAFGQPADGELVRIGRVE